MDTSPFKRGAEEAVQSVKNVQKALDESSGKKAFSGAGAGAEEVRERLEKVQNYIKQLKNQYTELWAMVNSPQAAEIPAPTMDKAKAKMAQLKDKILEMEAEASRLSGMKVQPEIDPQEQVQQETEKAKTLKDTLLSVTSKVKDTAKGLLGLKKDSDAGDKLSQGFKKGISSLLRYAFSLRALGAVFRTVKGYATEGMKNLAQYSSGTNAALSSMMSALTQMKNSFATAFSPIVEVVAPYITSFMKMISGAMTAVSAFFSALTGKSTYTKAVAVQQDYAASLQKTTSGSKKAADATKEAADAQKELNKQLMGFDEINKLDDNSSKDKDDDKKKDAGAGGGNGLTPDMMFTEEAIPGAVLNWADKFKEAWKNADFTEIGATVGQKFKDALDSIPWDVVKTQCEKVAKSLATFLNGFIEVPGLWDSIGKTIGNGLNVALNTLNTFWETFHWDSLAAGFSTSAQSAFNAFDWSELTRAISNIIIAALDFSKGLLEGIDWKQLPTDLYNALVEAIKGIKWKEIGTSFKELLKAAIDAVIQFSAGTVELGVKLIKSGWETVKKWVGSIPGVSQAVSLIKSGWETVKKWVGSIPGVSQAVSLMKSGWSTVKKWIGSIPGVSQAVSLMKSGWKTVTGWIGSIKPISVTIKLLKDWKNSVAKALGLDNLSSTFKISLPKVSVTWSGSPISLPHFSVKWNAKGGILNGAQLFGMAGNTMLGGGEAGKEAVLPLDRNTGWMDSIADKVAQRVGNSSGGGAKTITVNVTLDGRIVGRSVVNYIQGLAMAGQYPLSSCV